MATLSADQEQQFTRSGYLEVADFFNNTEIEQMQHEADRVLNLLINSSLCSQRTSSRIDLRQRPDGVTMVRKIQPLVDISPAFSDISQHQKILALLQHLFNEPAELMEEKLCYKQPIQLPDNNLVIRNSSEEFRLHNDWAYHRKHDYPPSIIGVGVFLDDVREESGPLTLWPGSQQQHTEHVGTTVGIEPTQMIDDINKGVSWVAPAQAIEPYTPVSLCRPAGTLVLFHCLLLHASKANTSHHPRRLLLFHYCPQSQSPGVDMRNQETRELESAYELSYQNQRLQQQWRDTFNINKITKKSLKNSTDYKAEVFSGSIENQ